MEKYCMSIYKYHYEISKEVYLDNGQFDDHKYPYYADDAQFYDMDISLPFSPVHTSSNSEEDDCQNDFDFNLSTCS